MFIQVNKNSLILCGIFVLFLLSPRTVFAQQHEFDVLTKNDITVQKWATIGFEEKAGFIMGVDHCKLFHLKKQNGFVAVLEVDIAVLDEYSKFIRQEIPNESSSAAWELMTTTKNGVTEDDVADYYGATGPDILWGSETRGEFQRGFLEGYISCVERHSQLRWSKPLAFYADKLNRYYNVDSKYGDDGGAESIYSQLIKYVD